MESPTSQKSLFATLMAPYATFIALFVGAGFISGGIVHLGEGWNVWDASLVALGVVLFVVGSYVQEVLHHQKRLREEGVLAFLAFSLLLSIGVGMASGGTQHFLDTPAYSARLIPLGLFVGCIAFILKQNIALTKQQWLKAVGIGAVLASALGLALSALGTRSASAPTVRNSASISHEGHAMPVMQNDAAFLQHMIPHHQEAVDTSAYVLTRTTRPELRAFVRGVIEVQAAEIEQMKTWHQSWFDRAYTDDGSYAPMMGNLSGLSGEALDQAYIQGMIEHHRGAIMMAEAIKRASARPEILMMADAIIRTQTQEIAQLEEWKQGEASTQGHHH